MKRLESLTFKQLRALESVATTGSISRAAELLALTPPAVHSQLKSLEGNFGCEMLHRDSRGRFILTGEGAALLEASKRANADLRRAVQRIDALHKGLAGPASACKAPGQKAPGPGGADSGEIQQVR